MSSPKTMFSGFLQLGLISIPITLGKAAEVQRESSLIQICDHRDDEDNSEVIRIDRSERCSHCQGRPSNKKLAIEIDEGDFYVFDDNEMNEIEDATKLDSLIVTDVQPASKLPLMYSFGAYYLRHDTKAKIAPTAMATLVAAMMKTKLCLVCKLGNASRQKLCVISAESGLMVLRQVPFLDDVRIASDAERAHMRAPVNPNAVTKMGDLLHELQNVDGFEYASYNDEGLKLRTEAVDRILKGEKREQKKQENKTPEPVDIFALIDNEVNRLQKEKQNV